MTRALKQKLQVYMIFAAFLINAASAVYASPLSERGLNQVLLCTSQGYQWVSIDDDTTEHRTSTHCPLCLAPSDSDNENGLLSPNTTRLFSLFLSTATFRADLSFYNKLTPYFLAQGRAPPFKLS